MDKRIAIVGTAQSWINTPWTDTGLEIASLNDAYRLKGFVRADRWYDFHPLNKFTYTEGKQIYAHQIEPGTYVRPADHLAWLAKQVIPIYLHPDYQTQHPEAANWPHAHAFPKAAIEEHFGRYFTSSPGWMLAQFILEGYREIHIYGIHLATESEYIEQRPNFEFLIGSVLGPTKRRITVKQGMRRYETQDGIVVLPEASPVLSSDFQYAFEPRPRAVLEPLKWDAHRYAVKRERAIDMLKTKPWWKSGKQAQQDLWRWDAHAADVNQQMQRITLQQQWS